VAVGDRLEALVDEGHHEVRVRSVQTQGRSVERIGPGNRVALNLVGVEHSDLQRGDAIVHLEQWRPTKRFDASLRVLTGLDHAVSRRGAYVAYVGSGEFPVRVRVLGPESIAPGTEGFVRIHLSRALALVPGDRFILRESGRNETVGGGEILDVAPVRPASKAKPDRSVDRVVAERGWIDVEELEAITGERRVATIANWVTTVEEITRLADAIRVDVSTSGALGLDVAVLDERRRAVLATMDDLDVDGGRVRPAKQVDPFADHPFLEIARVAGMSPPAPDGVDRATLRELVKRGHLVEREGIWFHRDAIDEAARTAARLLAAAPGGFTVAEFRDATGLTRKYVLPLLGELDARGMTRRRDDLRIAGPRLPASSE
jgi:selenocysteine-specific elongation factor